MGKFDEPKYHPEQPCVIKKSKLKSHVEDTNVVSTPTSKTARFPSEGC